MIENKVLVIIRGVPGSGKTTIADSLWCSRAVDTYCEADDYFLNDGVYEFKPELLMEAHVQCQEDVKAAMVLGRNVAVSNTFLHEKHVKPYLDMAEKYGYKVQEIFVMPFVDSIHDFPEEKNEEYARKFYTRMQERAGTWLKAHRKLPSSTVKPQSVITEHGLIPITSSVQSEFTFQT